MVVVDENAPTTPSMEFTEKKYALCWMSHWMLSWFVVAMTLETSTVTTQLLMSLGSASVTAV